ncbi:tRNA (N6-threonylcarbamoyladenosine(37)-N6)-methyltransferase TrmO, partial [Aeromonas salmonicida]
IAGYAQNAPIADMPVYFTADVQQQLPVLDKRYPYIERFIRQVLAQDPRPAYRKTEDAGKTYAVLLLDFNVRWRVTDQGSEVFAIETR